MTDDSLFIKLLGDYPSIRVLNYLIIYRDLDYSLTDIAEGSEVAWSTLNILWPRLEKMNVVIKTREVGKAKMFRLNTTNSVVKELMNFADNLVWDNSKLYSKSKQKIIA